MLCYDEDYIEKLIENGNEVIEVNMTDVESPQIEDFPNIETMEFKVREGLRYIDEDEQYLKPPLVWYDGSMYHIRNYGHETYYALEFSGAKTIKVHLYCDLTK